MSARLFCKYGEMKGLNFDISGDTTIGRTQSNTIVLQHKSVSGRHARIYRDQEKGCYVIEDTGSMNGTLVDGDPITEPQRLGHLHMINIGGAADFFFQDLERSKVKGQARFAPAGPALSAIPLPARQQPPVGGQEVPVAPTPAPQSAPQTIYGQAAIDLPPSFGSPSQTQNMQEMLNVPAEIDQAGRGQAPEMSGEAADGAPVVPDMSMTQGFNANMEVPSIIGKNIAPPPGGSAPPPPSGGVTADPSGEILAGTKKYCLVITNLDDEPLEFILEEGENVVGRSRDSSLRVKSDEISRRHAVLTVSEGKVRLKDVGSTNHSFVDGNIIKEEVEIKVGMLLGFGKIEGKLVLKDCAQ